jgi:NFU1 iron-sulfur cluster scaffold homolog, mitochondrial
MMRHYIPEVTGIKQVMDEEEEIALKEFERLEAKLTVSKARETSDAKESST